MMKKTLTLLILALALAMPALVTAQDNPPVSVEIGEQQRNQYIEMRDKLAKASKAVEALAAKVERAAKDDFTLADLKVAVEAAGKGVLDLSVSLQPRFTQVTKRLGELGPAPAADAPAEDPIVTADRKRLTAEKSEINALISTAETISSRAGEVTGQISDLRRDLFAELILERKELSTGMVSEITGAVQTSVSKLGRTVSSWAKFTWTFKRWQLLVALAISALIGYGVMRFVRRTIDPLFHRSRDIDNPSYTARLSVAFWSTVVPTISFTLYSMLFLIIMMALNALREDIADLASSILSLIIAIYFVNRLARGVLSPDKPQWRIMPVSDDGARRLYRMAVFLTAINAIDYSLDEIADLMDAPVVISVAKGFIASVLTGGSFIAMSFIKPMQREDGSGAWPNWLRSALMLAGVFLIVSASLGYIGLARFVSSQLVTSGAILITTYIGLMSGRALSRKGAFAASIVGQWLRRRFTLNDVRLDQIGLLAGFVIYVIAAMFGVPLMLLNWGFQVQDISAMLVRLFTEIRIGNITISLFGILGGVVVFLVGLVVTRWFQRWLDDTVMDRSQVDIGVRNSVNTATGYAGVAIAGLLGISAAGIDLSSFALVAGALSLGIGFGLQNIVSNFVSGLILLAERPFKVGDWVVTGKTEGFVKRISVRATEIETFQHQSIIVPNAELINSSLGNWTHRNKMGRTEIPVGVSYDADPRKVMEILLDIANNHPKVLSMPEPQVAFLGFGDFSLNFELRIYLADLLVGTPVRNELRLSIWERFRAEGIEIPYPQRNLNIRFDGDGSVVAEDKPIESPAEKVRAAARKRAEKETPKDDG